MASINNITSAVIRDPFRSPPEDTARASPRNEPEPAPGTARDGGKELPQQVVPGRQAPSPERIIGAVRQVNDFVQNYQRQLSFSIHEDTGITVVKVINTETDEVIRQIPPEEVLAIAEQIQTMLAEDGKGLEGMLVREKV